MNTKRIMFWGGFIIVIALIVWGLVVAEKKAPKVGDLSKGTPAAVTEADHIRGASSSPVTIIEYSDFECPGKCITCSSKTRAHGQEQILQKQHLKPML
ncbi:MAG: DsbA family protein [bacterium]|nr:DsbA family protein [bacterium]